MKWLQQTLACLALCIPVWGHAEDIDIFAGAGTTSSTKPNVLIILDNTANWNTPFTSEIAALANVVNSLPTDQFRLGMMLFTETGGGNSNVDGAYVRAAIRDLDAGYKTKFVNLVNSLHKNDDKSNGGKAGLAMWEAHQYFAALAPESGNNKNKTDYTNNTSGSTASNAIYALAGNALNAKAGSPYNSPIGDGCGKNYIIYISNGAAQDNASDTSRGTTALSARGGNTTTIALSPSGSQDNLADEWARYMYQSSLGVVTYTLDVDKVTTGQGPGWSSLLKSIARVSNGKYFDVNSSTGNQIAIALGTIFTEIQAVNSVFASVSLPVSVNTQGTYLNQVFIGQFRPDRDGAPRWNGNLKQYKLGLTNGVLGLQDADNNGAINTQTGFITECARSFWTPSTVDNYWAFDPAGKCLTVASSATSNYPDGSIVERGAQAYRLRNGTTSTRNVKTCSATFGSCTALTDFADGNAGVTQTALGAASSTERTNLINWSRGQDVTYTVGSETKGDENGNSNTTEVRPSVHGDVVHSRPVAINFGNDTSPQVVVFYGANDGMLRAINGNRSASIGSAAPGDELWSFMPPQFYGSVKRLRDNNQLVSFPTVTASGASPKPYGIDGSITAYRSSTATYLYAGMRRGGRVLYAFDVTTPASPTLKWAKGCPNLANDTDCTAGFSAIGQTWSPAVSGLAAGYGSGNSPFIMFGGGYDSCEDTDTNGAICGTTKGNSVFVLDADTGAKLVELSTDRGVVGEVTIVRDSNGKAIYAYATDLGGNIYRITIGSLAPASWTITKVASLGCGPTATDSCGTTPNRKFIYGPDVVSENGEYILLVGSGDREKPLSSYTHAAGVSNHFYMVRDKPSEATWLSSESSRCGASVICLASLEPVSTSTPSESALATKKGWYLQLSSTEKVVTSAITVFGTVTFSTQMPPTTSTNVCSSNLGVARVYNIAYTNASTRNGTTSRYETLPAGGLSPSPVAGTVILDNGEQRNFIIGGSGSSPLEAEEPPAPPGATPQPTKRVYWNVIR